MSPRRLPELSNSSNVREDSATYEAGASVVAYEKALNSNKTWGLMEGSEHFEKRSSVFKALHKVSKRLEEIGVPYAVAGGMALFYHGYRRFTEDIDLLVNRSDLEVIHEKLEGRGYLRLHRFSKNLRDTEFGVRIEFLLAGDFPGDGKPKPVSFPDPKNLTASSDDLHYIDLGTLLELKLASGLSNPDRGKDLVDVSELIKALNLPESVADSLSPYVRDKYLELWSRSRRKYVRGRTSISDAELNAMRADGVSVDDQFATTTDPLKAKKYDMVDESEYWEPKQS